MIELQKKIKHLEKKVENLQQAVVRWRIKAGVEMPDGDEPVLLKTELVRQQSDLFYYEHYLLPMVEKNPVLIRPAAQFVHDRGWTKRLNKLYFSRKGWVAVIRTQWL